MKYAFSLVFFLFSTLSVHERYPAAYWWDSQKNVFVEIEGHFYEINMDNHAIECPCDWAEGCGKGYLDSVKAAMMR